jgi:hypothetical protein
VIVVVLGLVLTSRDNNKPKSGGDGYYDNPYQ